MKIGLQTWGTKGDIQPFIALSAGLARAGHDVTLVVTDITGRDYKDLAARFGFQLVKVQDRTIPPPKDSKQIWGKILINENHFEQTEGILEYGFDPFTEAMFTAAQNLCAASDVVIGHFFMFPLRAAAKLAGVPVVTLNYAHTQVPSSWMRPPDIANPGRWFYPLGWKLVQARVNRIFLPRVNGLHARMGLPPDRDTMTQIWVSERLNLLTVSPAICRPPPDWGPNHSVCGFLNLPDEFALAKNPDGLDEFIAAGAPPIHITFGSMMFNDRDYLHRTVSLWKEAVQRVGCRAIFQLPCDDFSAFDTGKGVFMLKRAPYRTVFPKCAAIVHHGGAGTTQSSLLAGKPSVVVALLRDQFVWGRELERLGVSGPTLKRKKLSAKRLADAIGRVLGCPQMAARAAAIGKEMQKENGVETAVSLIEARIAPSSRVYHR